MKESPSPIGKTNSYLIRVALQAPPLVCPVDATAPQAFAPFPMPPMAFSLAWRLVALVALFRRRTGRTLSVGLTLDPRAAQWSGPLILPQRCTPPRATWHLTPERPDELPSPHLLAGSFTGGSLSALDAIEAQIPRIEGLHLYAGFGDEYPVRKAQWSCMLRAAGRFHRVCVGQCVLDDWTAALAGHADRLTLEPAATGESP